MISAGVANPKYPMGAHGGLGDGDSLDGVLGDSIHVTHWTANYSLSLAVSVLPTYVL